MTSWQCAMEGALIIRSYDTTSRNPSHRPPSHAPNMLRQQLIRSLKRPAHRAALNGSRAFTASAPRPAEVELTIGLCHPPLPARPAKASADKHCRWKEGLNRRYAASLTPLAAADTVLTPPNSRFGPHPGLRKGRQHCPAILLPREADDCR
jgi:hypothetical protein